MNDRAALDITTRSEDETVALGGRLARLLRPGDVVALHGELGSGKTRLVKGIAKGLGIDPGRIHSPTFVIIHIHDGGTGLQPGGTGVQPVPSLIHLDAYRLNETDDLAALGWDRIFDGSNIVVVEWAERIAAALPAERWEVSLTHAGETTRRVRIEAPAGRAVLLDVKRSTSATVRCRTCGGAIRADAPTAPFCSERCRLADLGKWFNEEYRVTRPLDQRDLEEGS